MRNRSYRREMKLEKDKRLRKIINECTRYRYAPHIGYIDWDYVDGVWQPVGKYIKYPKNSVKQKFLKRQSNRKVRRSDISTKGNGYRKCSEYWWIMY